jgi:cytochrome c biogenesis protein CcmG/thiol:disulfide interchange protein DsbE
MKRRTLALGFFGAFALAVILWMGDGARSALVPQPASQQDKGSLLPQPGEIAPDITLSDLEGRTVRLHELRGKPVLINFFASWCEPCRGEMPDLVKLNEKYGGQVAFYGVNLTATEGGDLKELRQFLRQYHVTYPILLDKEGQAVHQYKILGIPTTLTLDKNGVIVDRMTGALNETNLEAMVRKVLSQAK